MSLKIYNGMIYRNGTLSDVLSILNSNIKPKTLTIAEKKVASQISLEYFTALDVANTLGSEPPIQNPMKYFFDQINEAHHKKVFTHPSSSKWDYTSRIYATEIPSEHSVLILFESTEYASELKQLLIESGFDEFSYQNASDSRIGSASEEEWDTRKRVWDKAIASPVTPTKTFFEYSLVSWEDYKASIPFFEQLVNNQKPSDRARAKNARLQIEIDKNLKHLHDGSLSLFEICQKAKREVKKLEEQGMDYGVSLMKGAVYS